MTLSEFSKKISDEDGFFLTSHGEVVPIIVWQDLIRADGFKKTLESKFMKIEEGEFVSMARRPIIVPARPILKLIEADPYKAQDSTLNNMVFYPKTDEGWASATETEIRVHMYYYEK